MRRALFSFLFTWLFSQVATAVENPECFGIYAEYLIMRDARSFPFFAVPNNLNGRGYANETRWRSGYRVEGAYSFCPNDGIHLRWTQFPQFTGSRFLSPGISIKDSIGESNAGTTIKDKVDLSLYYLELFYMHDFSFCSPLALSLLTGVQYSHIRAHEQLEIFGVHGVPAGDALRDIFKSVRWGIGPELGVELHYPFCSCLSAEMRTTGSLMIARRVNEWEQPGIGTSVAGKIKDDTIWLALPFWDIRLGLNYQLGCFNVEAGYEIFTFFDGLGRFNPFDIINLHENLTMYGFYFQLGFAF